MPRFKAFTAASALALALTTPAGAQDAVKVGVLLTNSGPSGVSGQYADDTISVFQQRYGAIAGDKKIELVRRDTTGPNPEGAKRRVQELIVREKVKLRIGPVFTPNVLAAAPLVTGGEVPTIISGATTPGVVGEKSPYYLRTFFTIAQGVTPMAQYAYKSGVRKLLVVVADCAPGHEAEALMRKGFNALGGAVAGGLRVSVRSLEFSGRMQAIKGHDSPLNRQVVADHAAIKHAPNVAVWDALRLVYDGLAAQKGTPFDPDRFMAFAKGRRFESPRGPVAISGDNGDIVQNTSIRRVERRDGRLQNVEIETIAADAGAM